MIWQSLSITQEGSVSGIEAFNDNQQQYLSLCFREISDIHDIHHNSSYSSYSSYSRYSCNTCQTQNASGNNLLHVKNILFMHKFESDFWCNKFVRFLEAVYLARYASVPRSWNKLCTSVQDSCPALILCVDLSAKAKKKKNHQHLYKKINSWQIFAPS